MRTSDPDIYAAGDCVETTDLMTGKPCFVLTDGQQWLHRRTTSAAERIALGVLGSTVCKVFDSASALA